MDSNTKQSETVESSLENRIGPPLRAQVTALSVARAEIEDLRKRVTRLQEANETEVERRRAAERKAEGYRLTVEAQAEKLATGGRPVRVAIAELLEARAAKVDEETAGEEEAFFKGLLTTSDLRDWASLLRQVDAQQTEVQPQ